MLRTLLRSALIAALITGGSLFGAQAPASAHTKDTGCNANNPGRGCPGNLRRLGREGSPVCGKGKHVGNPHCRPAAAGTRPNVRSSGTRVVSTRTTPRANRAVAPRANKAVSTRAAKAL